jgi:hypothetical protein
MRFSMPGDVSSFRRLARTRDRLQVSDAGYGRVASVAGLIG